MATLVEWTAAPDVPVISTVVCPVINCANEDEVALESCASPVYTAVRLFRPTGRLDTDNVATPLVIEVAVPRTVVPL
jgi:hypothetical protein